MNRHRSPKYTTSHAIPTVKFVLYMAYRTDWPASLVKLNPVGLVTWWNWHLFIIVMIRRSHINYSIKQREHVRYDFQKNKWYLWLKSYLKFLQITPFKLPRCRTVCFYRCTTTHAWTWDHGIFNPAAKVWREHTVFKMNIYCVQSSLKGAFFVNIYITRSVRNLNTTCY